MKHQVRRDNKFIAEYNSSEEAYAALLWKHQGSSIHRATTHEGWSVVPSVLYVFVVTNHENMPVAVCEDRDALDSWLGDNRHLSEENVLRVPKF